ncbi:MULTISPECIES: LysR substrate-binding domain-containing protein [unclassified Pseudoalteromonas]|uniref:LysR substrate-binding domain-containing protein n=1 Tax=unclassified Pseudoalteromonas TaxID=194690 RepID=UPI002572ACEC|nr:LysR substrate-binding domain-containing protein [Pseudoalteromonas sp. MM1]BED89914.1 hydrogen peroxide-inducible genes activator [Pseudoalteromonas sp. MM1]
MNLKDLEYVKAIAHHKHFRKAAEACFVSQPTLSGQVKKLEQELGVVVFDRSTKQVTLTAQGERLLTQINVILEQAEILKELAATSNGPLQGKLRIGIIPTIAPYLLSALLTSMKAAFSDSHFSFIEMQTATILDALDNGELDFAILADVPELKNYYTVNVYKEDFVVAVSTDNSLSNRKKVALSDLQSCSLLMLSDGHCFKDQAQKFCFAAGVDVSNQYQGNSLETLLALVAINDGVTFVPKLACTPRVGIDYLPIFPNQQRNVVFACRKHYPHLAGVEQLAQWLAEHPNLKRALRAC